jgi:hypothetical protein
MKAGIKNTLVPKGGLDAMANAGFFFYRGGDIIKDGKKIY